MTINTIKTELKNIVDSVKTANDEISTTFDYMPVSPEGTPAVAVIFTGGRDEYGDTEKNKFVTNFVIRVMIEHTLNQTDDSADIAKILDITDDLLLVLRNKDNILLNNNTYKSTITSVSDVREGELATMKVLYVDISIEAKSLRAI